MATRFVTMGGGGQTVLQRQMGQTQGRGIYARQVPASMRNHPMVRLLDQVDADVRRLQVTHEQNGQQIAAWQQLPMGTAPYAREAQRLLGLVQQEAAQIEQILANIEEAYRIASGDSRLSGMTATTIRQLYDDVSRWHADAEMDLRGLREAISLGTMPPPQQQQFVEPPRTVAPQEELVGTDPFLREVHQTLERVGQERQALEDDFRAFKDAPKGSSDRMNIALTLLVQLNAEQTEQQGLSEKLALAIDAGQRQTGAGAQTRNIALREAHNVVTQWGQSLVTEIAQLEAAVSGD